MPSPTKVSDEGLGEGVDIHIYDVRTLYYLSICAFLWAYYCFPQQGSNGLARSERGATCVEADN